MEGRERWRGGIDELGDQDVEAPRRPAPGKLTSTSLIGNPDPPRWYQPAPGKRSLTMRLGGPGEGPAETAETAGAAADPVQRAAGAAAPDGAWVQDRAAQGVGAGSGGPLPFLDQIQPAFGRHDVGGVQAHVGGEAAAASTDIGARAYATGSKVAFGGPPDLHTAAHEAAHVVQQRGGVQLKGGVGQSGDVYERHADAVADAVVRGDPAEALLDSMAGSGSASSSAVQSAPVQRDDPEAPVAPKLPPPLHVVFGEDMFRLGFAKGGDEAKPTFDVKIDYTGPHPVEPTARSITLRHPLKGTQPINAAVKEILPTGVSIDVYRNDYDILKVADEIGFDADKKARTHKLREQMFGVTTATDTLKVFDPKGKPAKEQDRGPAYQEDVPGEGSDVIPYDVPGKNQWQIRMDLDGDQHKEMLVEITLHERYESGAAKTVEFVMTQLSTGAKVSVPKMGLADKGKPFAYPYHGERVANSDGHTPSMIYYTAKDMAAWGPLVFLSPPVQVGEQNLYNIYNKEGWLTSVALPKELPQKLNTATGPQKVGGFWTSDLTLGPYKDKFRLTIEPLAFGLARLGIAPIERADPKATLVTMIKVSETAEEVKVLKHDGVGIKLDVNGNGSSDIELFSRLAQPILIASDPSPPEQSRELYLRVRGPNVPVETEMGFHVVQGMWTVIDGKLADSHGAAATHAPDVLRDQAKLDTFKKTLDSYEAMMMGERKKAAEANPPLLSSTLYEAWKALSNTMVMVEPQVGRFKTDGTPVNAPLQTTAAAQAKAFYEALKADTPPPKKTTGMYGMSWTENPYTDEKTSHWHGDTHTSGAGPALSGSIASGSWDNALSNYERLVYGLDRWLLDQTKKEKGENDPKVAQLEYMLEMRREMGDLAKKDPKPVHAVFHPDAKYKAGSGDIQQVPLSLWYWAEGNEWRLKDLTNPKKPFEDNVAKADGDQFPPQALFNELDAKIHFPKGVIHYQIAGGGPGGKVITTERKEWHEWLAEIAMVAAIVGLALVTAGGGVAVAGGYILAASGLAGAVAAGGDMAEHIDHGALDSTTFVIDLMQIISGVASFGAFGAGRIILREGAAAASAGTAAKVAAPPAWLLNVSKAAYLPLRGAGMAADVVQLLALTSTAVEQFKELDKVQAQGGNPEEIDRAKRRIITAIAIQGGFTVLTVKGDLPALFKGVNLNITMKGKTPVAHVAGDLDPNTIKFSQENVKAATSDGIKIDDLKTSMMTEGWKGEPIHVVQLEDGSLVSLDNRRLMAARQAVAEGGLRGPDGSKVTTIPTQVHSHKEPIPQDWAVEGFVADKNVYRLEDGKLTTEKVDGAELVITKGQVATTYGEAATIRTANQGTIKSESSPDKGKPFPIGGSHEMPRVRQPAPAGGEGGTGGTGGNDVDLSPRRPLEDIDPDNDAARIQTKEINDQIARGDTKLDWGRWSKDGTTYLGAEYKKWIEGPDPVDFSGPKPKANYKGHPEFKGDIDAIVARGNVVQSLKARANAGELDKLDLKSMDPSSPAYTANRAKLIEKFGIDAVTAYESAKLGDAGDAARAKVFEQVNRVVGPDAITKLRNTFPDCEIYVTGDASRPGKSGAKQLGKIERLEVLLIVPDGVDGAGRALIEARAKTLSVPTAPEFATASGKSVLPVDATARTQKDAFGAMTAEKDVHPARQSEFARVDANVPGNAARARTELRGEHKPANDWIDNVEKRLPPEGKEQLKERLKVETPTQVMDSFAGDIDLAVLALTRPDAPRPPALKDTVDMFGVGEIPKAGPARWAYLEDPKNWKPARAALHDRLIERAKEQARQFADAAQKGEPTIYAMRGNTAAGKTRAVSGTVPELAGPMASTKDLPHRSVNPDNFKADLVKETPGMTSTQVHSESSMLATRLERELLTQKTTDGKELGSILIDKRLAGVGDVAAYQKMAKDSGRKFVLYDVDAPLEVSLAGVLERQPGGADPLPPFEVVAGGFKAVRNDRKAVIGMFADPAFGDYKLFATRPSGERVEIANVSGGKLNIADEGLYAEVTAGPGEQAELLATKRITSDAIDQVTKDLPPDRKAKVAEILGKYEGWTWRAALDAHSAEKPKK